MKEVYLSELKDFPVFTPYRVRYDEYDRCKKVPCSAITGRYISAYAAKNFVSYKDATASVSAYGFDGIGVMLGYHQELGGSLVCIDLDHCILDGKMEGYAKRIVDYFDSYAEVSPSGTGVHVLLLVECDCDLRKRRNEKVEILTNGYATLTEHALTDKPIAVRTKCFFDLYSRVSSVKGFSAVSELIGGDYRG